MSKFGEWLKEHREAQGLSQIELARMSGLNENTISSYELGQRSPSLNKAHLLAWVLAETFSIGLESDAETGTEAEETGTDD